MMETDSAAQIAADAAALRQQLEDNQQPDKGTDEIRERLIALETQLASFREAKARADSASEAEATAPLSERRGALPLKLDTLKFLPVEDQSLYERDIDGTFVLRWLRSDDKASLLAHAEAVGRGEFRTLQEGETPATRLLAEAKQAERIAQVNEILERDARAERERWFAEEERRAKEQLAAVERQREEYLRSLRRRV